MTPERRILEAIRATADPFDAASPIDVAKRAGINIGALAREAPRLENAGLVEVDEDAGTLSLTAAGRALVESYAAPAPTELSPGIGTAPQPKPVEHPMPDMKIEVWRPQPEAPKSEAAVAVAVPPAAPEPPTTEPVVGQLDLLPTAGMERIPGEPQGPAMTRPKSTAKGKKKPGGKEATKRRDR